MIKKQNIVTLLLLLVWATMFCFSVNYRAATYEAKPTVAFAAAINNTEELASSYQDFPIAWTEQSSQSASASTIDYSLQFYPSPSLWLVAPAHLYRALKPGKVLLAAACATIGFRILPNAP